MADISDYQEELERAYARRGSAEMRERLASINRYEVSLRQANKHSVHDEMLRLLCQWARETCESEDGK